MPLKGAMSSATPQLAAVPSMSGISCLAPITHCSPATMGHSPLSMARTHSSHVFALLSSMCLEALSQDVHMAWALSSQVLLKCHIFPDLSDNSSVPSPPFISQTYTTHIFVIFYILPFYKLVRNFVFHIGWSETYEGLINICSKNKWTSHGQPE